MSDILYNLIRRKDCVPGNPVVVYLSVRQDGQTVGKTTGNLERQVLLVDGVV